MVSDQSRRERSKPSATRSGFDSGEIEEREDGTISVPILEEQAVIQKRLIVRERVNIRKREEVDEHSVRDELRRERVELEDER